MESPKNKKKAVSFSMTPDLDERLSILAHKLRTTKSSLVEEWLFEKVEYYESMEASYGEKFSSK